VLLPDDPRRGGRAQSAGLRHPPGSVPAPLHPGCKSRPERPHPLFDGFVEAAIAVRDGREPSFRARPVESGVPAPTPVSPPDPVESVPSA